MILYNICRSLKPSATANIPGTRSDDTSCIAHDARYRCVFVRSSVEGSKIHTHGCDRRSNVHDKYVSYAYCDLCKRWDAQAQIFCQSCQDMRIIPSLTLFARSIPKIMMTPCTFTRSAHYYLHLNLRH